ncbi:thiamine pyrophosphate-requiring protein [Neorhizobium galegae]|uniref:thiamine pyrophosphate-requiring protein n=1 Tax=Neorhizobium galegae TaxID=399 RepID=UPI000621A339|nr:thiamine pyrophosphate-requiring protein [Neorhizobium galegae]CDZ56756.1 Acetolactate synthase catalytic subunit [Neorhizobium galegae bv. orientalis]KAB1122820.1 thiamine pyrophosphate-requiring protein [Neorhizobium galegae]MCQ1570200.1 thiamine pyrophosphate-requiring protein [Neorhizobium galegae]MCQ1807735.1 thiamine pyrophosphate-requiring protein [Neorhizobium galegae]CDZ64077.1 Acetolactate synthase catalytic subunit [Neorhizobium galegae bv. orientalis]
MKHEKPTGTFAAEAVLSHMKAAGIDVLFANGGTDFPSIIEAFARQSETGLKMPEALVIPHEGVAVGMAHGYYLMTSKPAGVIVHVNVGLANSVMGLINARSENVPVMMFSGRTPITEHGRFGSRSSPIHWGQEMFDQGGMVREVVKWDYELRYPEQAGIVIDRAMSIAMSEPRGPVYLSLPREALAEGAEVEISHRSTVTPTIFGPADPELVAQAADLLAKAKNPLIITQSPELAADFEPLAGFVEKFALPTIEMWATRLALPSDHPMMIGRDSTQVLKEADVVVVINAAVPWISDHTAPAAGAKIIAIGPDPQHSRVPIRSFPIDIALAGGVNKTIAALAAAMSERVPAGETFSERREKWAKIKAAQAEAADKRAAMGNGSPMTPAYVSRCISDILDDTTTVVNELGIDPSVMSFKYPKSYFSTPLSGGLGFGLTAALGAQLADRSRQVIATIGDGSYMFANPVACHQTATALKLPLLTVVFNNGIWNAVRRSTLYMYPDGSAATANTMPITALDPAPDYAAVARAHGAHAERVETGADLPAALQRALAATRSGQQAMIEVMVSY